MTSIPSQSASYQSPSHVAVHSITFRRSGYISLSTWPNSWFRQWLPRALTTATLSRRSSIKPLQFVQNPSPDPPITPVMLHIVEFYDQVHMANLHIQCIACPRILATNEKLLPQHDWGKWNTVNEWSDWLYSCFVQLYTEGFDRCRLNLTLSAFLPRLLPGTAIATHKPIAVQTIY